MRSESGLIGYIIGAAVFFAVSPIFSAMDSVNLKNFFAPYPCPLVFLLANIFVNLMVVYVSGLFLYRLKKSMEGETYRRFFPLTCRWVGLIDSIALSTALILLFLLAEAAVKMAILGNPIFRPRIDYLMMTQLIVLIAVASSCLIMRIENERAEKYIRDYTRRMIRKMGLYN